ncbi:putative bifunctional diguanylate cyclase/phosphodiesterase [Phenylobacterium sp.]|jgi:EAL domain-containing protein (putative c-di-GMP-specific phosphodiesterase class I)/GGDEF domain-containing protein|uniref:putative bifunctional diguanylate cyclase/phosphodiesterase n=1 Tax=Phenylobacterium sp. TaxID=1871053 RepID=UPI002F939B62
MLFQRLSTKLTVLYGALFGAVLLLVSVAVFTAVGQAAQKQVHNELAATGAVFDQVWRLRTERLLEGAVLLSRDFGFREAVATHDEATIVSAMQNLSRRLEIDRAFIVGADGKVIGAKLSAEEAGELQTAFASGEDPAGVLMLDDRPYQVVSAPVLSPDLIGWVVFATELDSSEMAALERLAAIPLQAVVLHREARHGWEADGLKSASDQAVVRRFIERILAEGRSTPQALDLREGRSLALVKRLPTLDADGGAVLVLRYPMGRAMAPFRPLLLIVAGAGLLSLLVVGWGSWALARGVTRPISDLGQAAYRLQRGEDAQVAITTHDELGHLAQSFNTMATAIRDRERRITHLALHDEETGLPNRLTLERVVSSLSDRPQGQVYVAALGIQRFEQVRGAIGYALAAQAVRMIGNRLAGLAPSSGVARIATDVLGFTIIAQGPEAAEDDALRLMAELEHPLNVGRGDAIDVSLNLGLAPLDRAVGTAGAIEFANIALDQARASRRKVSFFDAEAYGDPAANLSLMSSMLGALAGGQMHLHYQPKFDLRRREVTGLEALARWRHPVRGMLGPDLFVPMAEETGHVRELTEWVLRRAIADQKALAAAGHELEVAVNISGRTLGEPDFADVALKLARTANGRLCFEITETAVIENPDVALAALDRFAAAGIAVSIDDFGTGLSSLAYLKRIRGHELKIDKSIVHGVTESQRDALIVRSTVDLAHSLGLKVTAEGVETEACFALLSAMGCDRAQGYLIAKPLPLKELLTFLSHDRGHLKSYG